MTDFSTLFEAQPTYEALKDAFDAIEADLTYIDDTDIVRYFSPFRIFDRPASCLNENVFECHPERVHKSVEDMIWAFRAGEKETVSYEHVSHDRRPVRVCYHAMRDQGGRYLGCLEVVTYRD